MRRARLLRRPQRPARPVHPSELGGTDGVDAVWEMMLHFRHRRDEAWYETLIAEAGLEGRKLSAKRVRKLLLKALERYREEKR